jgi:predicted aspartyl protease
MNAFHRVGMMAAACAALLVPGLTRADCQLLQIAEFKLDPNSYSPTVEGSINGHPVKVLIDTGDAFSMVTQQGVDRLGLPTIEMMGMRAHGVSGDTQVYRAHIDQLKIDAFAKANLDLLVALDDSRDWPIAITLGDDVLSKLDVEFDLAHNAVRLFQPKGCAPPQLVYWGAAYSQVELVAAAPNAPAILARAFINGKPILAELDSRAALTVVDATVAAAVGVARPVAANAAESPNGANARREASWTGRFDTFALGDEKISNPNIEVLGFGAQTETASMLIGDDFLRAHRVFVDNQDHLILFSYQGGPVFSAAEPAPPAK